MVINPPTHYREIHVKRGKMSMDGVPKLKIILHERNCVSIRLQRHWKVKSFHFYTDTKTRMHKKNLP